MDKLYGIGGLLTDDASSNDVFAKAINEYTYYVRTGTSGPEAGHLLNPWSMYYVAGVTNAKMENAKGTRTFEFRKVSKACFDMYVSYLETRNERFYRQAERSLS